MNDAITVLVEDGKPHEAAVQMEIYLNLAERTMLKALERAGEHGPQLAEDRRLQWDASAGR